MGSDKAFLDLGSKTFISVIADEMLGVCHDVVVVIGRKRPEPFMKEIAHKSVRLVNDRRYVGNPLGGMLTGLEASTSEQAAVVACDLPLIRGSMVSGLFAAAEGHDGAVPIWNPEDRLSIEPLCAVYRVQPMIEAIQDALSKGVRECKRVVLSLSDINYVHVSELKKFDPNLGSLRNINTGNDYLNLLEGLDLPAKRPRGEAQRRVRPEAGVRATEGRRVDHSS